VPPSTSFTIHDERKFISALREGSHRTQEVHTIALVHAAGMLSVAIPHTLEKVYLLSTHLDSIFRGFELYNVVNMYSDAHALNSETF
jgi:hypothetical protein